MAYADLGNVPRAINYYEQALAIARDIGDRFSEGNQLSNPGLAYATLGNARRAIDYFEHSLVIARQTGDRRGEAFRSWNLGLLPAPQLSYTRPSPHANILTLLRFVVIFWLPSPIHRALLRSRGASRPGGPERHHDKPGNHTDKRRSQCLIVYFFIRGDLPC